MREAAETMIVAGAGALLFTALKVPAGAILGALLFTAAASLAGRKLAFPPLLRTIQLYVIGVGVGAAVTPAALFAAADWPFSIVAVVLCTLACWYGSARFFQRFCRTDARTAAYATAPGTLTAVMLMAEVDGADMPRVTVAQTVRMSALVALAPLAFTVGDRPAAPPDPTPLVGGHWAWAILIAGTALGWAIGKRLRWPIPVFLGSLLGSAAVHGAGLVDVHLPREIVLAATAGIGAVIGARFSGVRVHDLVRFLAPSAAVVLVMAALTAPIGWLVARSVGVEPMAGLMAFSPGSMEMMIAAALALNADPSYVAAHHVARTLLLMTVLPILSARLRRAPLKAGRKGGGPPEAGGGGEDRP